MIYSILILVAGFVAGLFYSRGKADPVQAAWFDLKRVSRYLRDKGIAWWRMLGGQRAGRQAPPRTIDVEDVP